jgi:hypothetical protein
MGEGIPTLTSNGLRKGVDQNYWCLSLLIRMNDDLIGT